MRARWYRKHRVNSATAFSTGGWWQAFRIPGPLATSTSMSEPSQNPPDWIALVASTVSGLKARHLLDLAALLDPARSALPSSGQLQRALSLSTASAAQLARGFDQVMRFPGV